MVGNHQTYTPASFVWQFGLRFAPTTADSRYLYLPHLMHTARVKHASHSAGGSRKTHKTNAFQPATAQVVAAGVYRHGVSSFRAGHAGCGWTNPTTQHLPKRRPTILMAAWRNKTQ